MNLFKPIDLELAAFVLGKGENGDVFQLVAYLTAALRQGYSFIKIGQILDPSPNTLAEEDSPLSAEESAVLGSVLLKGMEKLRLECPSALVLEEERLSFELYHSLHKKFKDLYSKHLITPPRISIDQIKLKELIEELQQTGVITFEQGDAIYKGCTQSITLISGGPGTGKTYTAGVLLALFWRLIAEVPCKIVLAAPTGKAAANLQKSFSKFANSLPGLQDVQATTLHALLRLGGKRELKPLDADLILIDESSMIDTKRMVALMEAVKPGTRIIFMGDPYQLPPVEVGGLFAELIQAGSAGSLLTKCQRTDLAAIVEMAQAILEGRGDNVILNTQIEPFLEEALAEYTPPENATIEELLNFFSKYRILSPVNRGAWGCETINAQLFTKLTREKQEAIVPIMVTKNDRTLNLNNGDVGILVGGSAYFSGVEVRKIPAIALAEYTLAYCLSVHKSQGSEFDKVLLLWPEGAERFGRPGLYTGVTRAKKRVDLVCAPETFKKTLLGRDT